jgi:CCR4-NOT transcription complex subunit 6
MIEPTARRWLAAAGGAGAGAYDAAPRFPADAFRVATYNILAAEWATPAAFPGVDAAHLAWGGEGGRGARVAAELDAVGADVVCLQEVGPAEFDGGPVCASLRDRGYVGWHYGRCRAPGGDEPAFPKTRAGPGPALFVRAARFDAAPGAGVSIRFAKSALATEGVDGCGASVKLLKRRGDGAVAATVVDRLTAHTLLLASTHLFWDPYWADVKALQAAALAGELAREAASGGAVAVVVGADLNSLSVECASNTPSGAPCAAGLPSGAYALLTTGTLPAGHPHHPARRRGGAPTPLTDASLGLASMRAVATGEEPPLTTRTAAFAGVLDYVLASAATIEPLGWLEDPAPAAAAFGELPDAVYPSDHVLVGVVLRVVGERRDGGRESVA